jgi:hypothetical protein
VSGRLVVELTAVKRKRVRTLVCVRLGRTDSRTLTGRAVGISIRAKKMSDGPFVPPDCANTAANPDGSAENPW